MIIEAQIPGLWLLMGNFSKNGWLLSYYSQSTQIEQQDSTQIARNSRF